jgi:hypothetical protein
MKKLLLHILWITCCFSNLSVFGQAKFTGSKKDYTESMDSLLTFVDKTRVSTGILYDRVMSFTSLNMLKENNAITKSNNLNFIQSWSELHRAAYNPTFNSLESLKRNIAANTDSSRVDIGVINTKINYIDYGTPQMSSLIFDNGYFQNVNGINPFLEKQITVISPLVARVESQTVSFRLQSAFMLQLSGLPITNLVADFGNGTSYNMILNGAIVTASPRVTYTTGGKKELIFTVTFSDNSIETILATIDVKIPNQSQITMGGTGFFPAEENFTGIKGITTSTPGNIAFQGYNESIATKGVLEYRTYYNTVSNPGYNADRKTFSAKPKILKPIIILDGYDPGDGRKIYPGSNGYDSAEQSIYELMSYDVDNNPDTNNSLNLVDKLRSAPYGFDVTLVNFPNGADYIERNAMALVALISRERAKLSDNASTEQISIIGPSMGGLISRYALAYMEKNSIPHNTKLWVSFDSPHLGANIPIAAQENLYFFGYKGRKDDAKVKFDENFRSPAARQMLIEQLDNVQESAPYPTTLWDNNLASGQNNNTPFRQQFQTNQNSNGISGSNGYPQNLRKIALINGTTTGANTNSAGQRFLELAAFTDIKMGQIFGTPIIIGKIKVAIIEDNFLSNTGSSIQTFSGKVSIPRVAGLEVHNGTVNRTNSNPRGSMDVVQGGTYNTQGIIKDEFTLVLNNEVDSQEWRKYVPHHAFIPSVSSLAFKNPNFNWSTALNRNLVCDPNNKEIYFDSYFAPKTNEDHVLVTAESAAWLIKELQGIDQAPSFPIAAKALSGPETICTSAVYSFQDICAIPGNATWTKSANLTITSSNGFSVNVTKNGNGAGFIEATFQNGVTFTKNVWLGLPTIAAPLDCATSPIDDPSCTQTLCKSFQYLVDNVVRVDANGLSASSTNADWEWVKLSDNFNWVVNQGIGKARIQAPQTGPVVFKVRVKNACGWSPWLIQNYTVVNCASGFASMSSEAASYYKIFPNPASDIVSISLANENNIPENTSTVSGELFDMSGLSKATVQIINNQASFSVAGLPLGIYVLNISVNGLVEGHQIAVE